ncbi:MAG: ATP-binding protein [Kiritimatiellae bacterium]|nr:ATP-binding protein [Kiritimatiellia bacterium]
MIEREIANKLKLLVATFPVVTIEGPRQSGKTTLAKMVFPEYAYANLEDSATRRLAESDPQAFFEKFPCPAIIDEIQRVPDLLSAIQSEVDRRGGNGLFVLTGSHQPRLREGVSQSLAGRTALLTLLPFSIRELGSAGIVLSRDEYMFKGFLPAVYDRNQDPNDVYEAYYRTYVEKDVRQLINVSHQREFELFLRLLAGRVGQIVNLEAMSGEVGVSATTLKEWLSVLEASFVLFILQPYYNNFGKRFVKSPKIYFTDVGLAVHLLDITNPSQVARDPLIGGLFENLVVVEALKARLNRGVRAGLYYIRGKSGSEIDLVVEEARRIHGIEIKSSKTPDDSFVDNMNKFVKSVAPLESKSVVYSGDDWPIAGGGRFINFKDTAKHIDAMK